MYVNIILRKENVLTLKTSLEICDNILDLVSSFYKIICTLYIVGKYQKIK